MSKGAIKVTRDGGVTWEIIDTIKGEPGPQGPQGTKGDKGDQGIQGDQGEQGIQGGKGDTGADSTVPGPKGDTGADSVVPGPKGDQGEQGLSAYAAAVLGGYNGSASEFYDDLGAVEGLLAELEGI